MLRSTEIEKSLNILVVGSDLNSVIKFRANLIKEYIHAGHSVFVCGPTGEAGIISQIESWGCQYRPIPIIRHSRNIFFEAVALFSIFKLMFLIKPFVVIPYTIKPVVYCSLCGFFLRNVNIFPLITGLGYAFGNETNAQKIIKVLAIILYRVSFRYIKGILFQNSEDRDLFIEKGIISNEFPMTIVDGSGVDTASYAFSQLPKNHNFLMVARLLKDKGVIEYCKAAEIVKKSFPNANFYLVGDVDVNPMSIKLSEIDFWISNKIIHYKGYSSDVRQEIIDCRYFVLPSYREGMPRSTLEAMSMGRPIITTNVPGCNKTVIEGFNGYLVPAKDFVVLSSVMADMIMASENCIAAMGKNSRRLAEEKFEVKAVTRKMNEFIFSELFANEIDV